MVKKKLEIVTNKKDSKKILYKVIEESENDYLLTGINYRIKTKVEKRDVEKASDNLLNIENTKNESYFIKKNYRLKNKRCLLGTVLHIDTDEEYLNKCVDLYNNVDVYVYPMLCDEENLSKNILNKNLFFNPDVIVITGHDYFYGNNKKDIKNYMNSKYYIDAVLCAKQKYPNSVIVAGACQSLFEALIASGANFASSPKRKNIHVYDPAVIAITVCTTSHKQIVDFEKVNKYISDFKDAFGGVETFGKMKVLY